jgi:hypothetical protein
MFTALAKSVIDVLSGNLVDRLADLFKAYMAREITRDQLVAEVGKALLASIQAIELSHAQVLGQTYDAFIKAAAQSRVMQWVWATVVWSQLAVLLWHQVGISALVYVTARPWPSSGSTVEWAYLLVGGLCGLGPLVLRRGPGALSYAQLAALVRAK